MSPEEFDAWEAQVRRIVGGANRFAAEMQEKGIHVGMGSAPRCVKCGQAWPCEGGAS